ncbi:platelet-activating factor acetylhydrolase IB subunit alpha1-like [Artemia franciscana]|uniref:SGNH hydrolase-type esterase domain-containing protein n=1 Tax=Artemia franciscana TaxID=6661 RepID=A0AA88HET1_ARTSF|nr:hypothetical protein QYM36_015881 [Artemia franciscana]
MQGMPESEADSPSKPEDIQGDGRWLNVHERFLSEGREKEPEVVLIGDSLLSHLSYTQIWSEKFVPLHCLNFGISGDQTQHVLWRVENGELDNVNPKAVVLLVGTNNVKHGPKDVANGILKITLSIQRKLPSATIFVLSLLPRGKYPNPLREKNKKVNELLKEELISKNQVKFVDISSGMVQPDGTISHLDLHDYLHLSVTGYEKIFSIVYNNLLSCLIDV